MGIGKFPKPSDSVFEALRFFQQSQFNDVDNLNTAACAIALINLLRSDYFASSNGTVHKSNIAEASKKKNYL